MIYILLTIKNFNKNSVEIRIEIKKYHFYIKLNFKI